MNTIKITPRPVMPDLSGLQSKAVTGKDNDESFGDFLSNAIEGVNTLQQESGEAQGLFADQHSGVGHRHGLLYPDPALCAVRTELR